MTFDYEAEREANIKRNNELLISLGIEVNVFMGAPTAPTLATAQSKPKPKPKKPTPAEKKVVDEADYDDKKDDDQEDDKSSEDDKPRPKKVKAATRPTLGTRRSARNESKPPIDYASEEGMRLATSLPTLVSKAAKKRKRTTGGQDAEMDDDDDDENARPRDRLGKRTKNPKTYGHISGIPIGKTWELR